MKTISNPQTKYELELRVLKSTEITYRYVLMRNRLSKLRKFTLINENNIDASDKTQT